ncbi:MAG: efflux RND transporter periplasmic adaptor subunit [Opitutaceae bacterium]|nr:efflux RND transporter periplasmic adaptor subunit [Opitutaceae bacterium]
MAKSRRSTGLVVIVLLLAAAAGGWYYFGRTADAKPVYTTVTVDRGSIAQVVTATGSLQPVTSVEVGSQVSGLITEVLVDYNSPVKAGQLIAKIDSSTYEQRLRQAEADLASSKASHTLTRLNTERTRALRTQNLVSAQELDQAEAQLSQADAALLTREAAVENAKVDLSRCSIFSPIDGIVIDRQTDVGKTVAASFNAPTLFIIANDLTRMQIHASIAEADIGSVAVEQPVNFTVDAFPNRQFRGRVIQIRNSPKTESNVVTYQTIIEVRNDDQKLKPGMTANVSIVIAERPDTLRLPNGALRARIPEQLLPAAKADATAAASPAAGAAPVTATREQVVAMLAEVGFVQGSGPPSPEIRAKLADLAKSRGLALPDFGRGRGGSRTEQPAITTRTVYKLGGTPAEPRPEPVTVKLGITDGTHTEIIEGLSAGDVLISSVFLPGATTNNASPSSSPFGGPRRF